MAKRTIKYETFPYRVEIPAPGGKDGDTIVVEKLGRRGETVDIPFKDDVALGDRLGAFGDPGVPPEPVVGERDLTELGEDELALWIEDQHPTVSEVVDAAGGDPEVAKRLLAAENSASGQDPRKGVVDGLAAVISRAGQ